MKHTATKLFALILAAAMLCGLCLTAGAVEMDKSAGQRSFEDLRSGMPDYTMESAKEASDGTALGIFALEMKYSGSSFYFTAFLVEQGGETYLITDPFGLEVMKQSDLKLLSSGNGGYSSKVSILGADMNAVYLKASGLEDFVPLRIASEPKSSGVIAVEKVQNGKPAGLVTGRLDFSGMDIYTMSGTEDVAIFDVSSEPADILLGAPILDEDTAKVLAMGSADAHPETGNSHPVYYTILEVEFDDAYALDISGGSGTKTEPDDRDEDRDEDRDDDRDDRDEDEEEESSSVKPLWLVILAVAAVAAFLYKRSQDQNKAPGAGSPVPGPVYQKPAMAPQYDMAARWQLKGITGCFSGKTFPITGTLRLGRNDNCQVRFPQGTPGISGSHCEISLENGSILLTDLGSSYGTFAGGGKLAPHAPVVLESGGVFTLAQGESFQVERVAVAEVSRGITLRDIQGRTYHADSDKMAMGRGRENKVVFSAEDKTISTSHCVLFREEGKLYLMDLGSTNGTFFSEENRLQPNTPYRIRKGMAFFLADRKNTFVVLED